MALDDKCLDNEGDDAGCLDNEFRELSALPRAIPGGITARDFVSADDDMQTVADHVDADIVPDIIGADDTNSSSGKDCDEVNQPPYTAAELAFSIASFQCHSPLFWHNGRRWPFSLGHYQQA